MVKGIIRQNYLREDTSPLANISLFPKSNPQLPLESLHDCINKAFNRSKKTKTGDEGKIPDTPDELVKLCLSHIGERADPILGTSFYSQFDLNEIFDMDAIPHEMQRQRMKIGVFYQYLIIEIMRASRENGNKNIIEVFDGAREGDVVADIKTPGFDKNLRLYMSVKKSIDTVGGQDIPGVIGRLEAIAKEEKNLTSPYLCVLAIASPTKGKIFSYEKSRLVKYTKQGHSYSENCEVWLPGFLYPYISGRSAIEIYTKSLELIDTQMPFYSLKFREECTTQLKDAFIKMGIADETGKIIKDRFFAFTAKEV